jgi:hypothetical protein
MSQPPELPAELPWFVRNERGEAKLIRHLDPAGVCDERSVVIPPQAWWQRAWRWLRS